MKDKSVFMNNDETLGKVYAYTGLNFRRERWVKSTRKEHSCLSCKTKLPRRSEAFYISGRDPEMGFQYYYLCLKCYSE